MPPAVFSILGTFRLYMSLLSYLQEVATPPPALDPSPVPEGDVAKMVEGARWSPSAENVQAWRFVAVHRTAASYPGIVGAIRSGDQRLDDRSTHAGKPVTAVDLDRMAYTFTSDQYDAMSDPYKQDIDVAQDGDVVCIESAGLAIVCTYVDGSMARMYGELEIGGAILNIMLVAASLGYQVRWIRNFDRDSVRAALAIPEQATIVAVLAIGFNADEASDRTLWNGELARAALGTSLPDMILDRRSVRDFVRETVPREDINAVKAAGEAIPAFSAKLFFKIQAVDDAATLGHLANEARLVFVKQRQVKIAPVVFGLSFKVSGSAGFYGRTDVGAAFGAVLMEAYGLGIGTCWIGAFNHRNTRAALELPDDWRIEGIVAAGRPAQYLQPPARLSLGKIAFENAWGAPLAGAPASRTSRSGPKAIILRTFTKTDTKTLLRYRDAGVPLVPAFKALYDKRVGKNKKEER